MLSKSDQSRDGLFCSRHSVGDDCRLCGATTGLPIFWVEAESSFASRDTAAHSPSSFFFSANNRLTREVEAVALSALLLRVKPDGGVKCLTRHKQVSKLIAPKKRRKCTPCHLTLSLNIITTIIPSKPSSSAKYNKKKVDMRQKKIPSIHLTILLSLAFKHDHQSDPGKVLFELSKLTQKSRKTLRTSLFPFATSREATRHCTQQPQPTTHHEDGREGFFFFTRNQVVVSFTHNWAK